MTAHIDKAFILAAGIGSRLRPYTDQKPKPMVDVAGKPIVDHILDKFFDIGVRDLTLNLHYKAHILEDHLKAKSGFDFLLSFEESLLDTGGGIMKMLDHFQGHPFFVTSGDAFWVDKNGADALSDLQDFWNYDTMDILMLLQPISNMHLTHGVGDYDIDNDGCAVRSLNQTGTHMFTSIRINHPRIFEGCPDGAFSYLELMDRAQEKGRLFGLSYNGDWHHISTPKDLDNVNEALVNSAQEASG